MTDKILLAGDSIVFDASASFDSDGEISEYLWDFGDGTNKSDKVVKYAFTDVSVFEVT